MQHAHQKGIIHRDLKPGNVLVTEVDGRPTPKVIDFGVAKATEFKLTDQSLADTGAIVGTPTYMSPEQADPSSMDIDTRTDVYALGVILYELLAGSPPIDAKQFKRGAILEMLRMVREVDPPRPSTKVSTAEALPSIAASRDIEPAQLKRALQGDLDWIVMKALEKDRTRRYETANGFAADILRHLAYEPVLAAPPSRAYRLRKFVRKHRGAVIAASLVVLALLAGIAGTTWGLIRAERSRAAEGSGSTDATRSHEAERVKERDAAVKVADARAEELKYQLGVSDFLLASAAYDNRDVILAAERLDNVPHGAARLGMALPEAAHARRPVHPLWPHGPRDERVVQPGRDAGSSPEVQDKTAKVWDARTGHAPARTERAHRSGVTSASFSPDGTRIVTGSEDKTAKVWDARTGDAPARTERAHERGDERVVQPGRHADRHRQLGPDGEGVGRAGRGRPCSNSKAHGASVSSASFSPDGTRIVTGSEDKTAKVWDARTGTPLLELKGHTGRCDERVVQPGRDADRHRQ